MGDASCVVEYEGDEEVKWLVDVVGVSVGVGSEKMESERSMLVLAEDPNEASDKYNGGWTKEGEFMLLQIFVVI